MVNFHFHDKIFVNDIMKGKFQSRTERKREGSFS